MTFEPIDVEAALAELQRVLARRAPVAAEFVASREQFAAPAPAERDEDQMRRAARRHAEWFFLERPSASLGGAPVEWALHHREDLGDTWLSEQDLQALLSSRCGVFELTSVTAGQGVWVRDLGAGGEYPLHEPEAAAALEGGDLIVGRLFAVGDSLYVVSPAAGVFRSSRLREALVGDLERLRQGRRGVLRLSQVELEHMFFAAHAADGSGDAASRALAFLTGSGVPETVALDLLAQLRAAPFEPQRWAHGVRDTLAEVLERLAFEYDLDLERARRVLLEAWPELASADAGVRAPRAAADASTRAGRGDVHAAIEAFDRGRDAGRDLEELFGELERDLELESDPVDPDAIDGAPAPDFPGVVAAMVAEFQWEVGREGDPAAALDLAPLTKFAQFGESIGVFENLGAHELALFATVWLPERGALRGADDARAVLHALRRFCAWAQDTQDVRLRDAYDARVAPLEDALARLSEANLACERGPGRAQPGELWEVLARDERGLMLRNRRGREQHASFSRELDARLEVGDWVRAELAASGARAYCCYPAQLAELAP